MSHPKLVVTVSLRAEAADLDWGSLVKTVAGDGMDRAGTSHFTSTAGL